MMALHDISHLRLRHQQIEHSRFSNAQKLVSWMGAMQAQDFSMGKWAIGLRTGARNHNAVQKALDKGGIIRTHVLRPTWHFISAADAHWMLDLTAPHIKKSLSFRQKYLELTSAILRKSCGVIEKALIDEKHLTREALAAKLSRAKIATHEQRTSHIFLHAELEKLICSGPMNGKKTTYALFADRIPASKTISREQAVTALMKKYFQSHGPATLQDFIWWSGLPVADAKQGLESIRKALHSEVVGGQTYLFKDAKMVAPQADSVHLLPAFDEFLISYKDRRASVTNDHQKITASINGIFWPIIVINGQVTGLWKRTFSKNKVLVTTEFFPKQKVPKTKEIRKLIDDASERVRSFFGNAKVEE